MFTLNELLEIAVQMERNGEKIYLDAMDRVSHPELKSLLKWMADEEVVHADWFVQQKKRLSLDFQEANLKEMVPNVLQEMMGDKTLALDDIDFERITTAAELMQTFVGFEKDTILFYELLEMFIQDDRVQKGLHKIIIEEKNHVTRLKEIAADLTDES